MKITEYGTVSSASDVKRRRKAESSSSSSFATILDGVGEEDVAAPSTLSDVGATASVGNMLALQEITEEEVQRKKMLQKGKNLLDSLEKLRHQLLIGAIPLHTLQDLTRQLSIQKQNVSDPMLIGLIEDIELRAAVELAKLEQALKDADKV